MGSISIPAASREWWRKTEPTPATPAAGGQPYVETRSSRWAYWALVAFVVVNLVSPQSFVPALEPLRLAFLTAIAAAATHLLDRWSGGDGLKRAMPRQATLIWCLVGWAIVTIPSSLWPGGSFNFLVNQYLKTVIVFWLVGNVVTRTDRLRNLFWILAWCSVFLALATLKNAATGQLSGNGGSRVMGYGLATNPNDLALTLNILIPLTASLALTARTRTELLTALGIIAISVPAIVVTFSRCGFLTLAAISVLSAFNLMRRGHWGVIAAALVVSLMAIPALPAGYLDRLSTIGNVEADTTGSAQERVELMNIAVGLVQARPIFGAGINEDLEAIGKVKRMQNLHVHNAYLVCAVDLGLPGALLFIGALLVAIRTSGRVERQPPAGDVNERDLPTLAGGVRMSLVAFAIAAFFAPVPYQVFFYYLAGLSVATFHCWTSQTAGVAVATRASAPRL